MQALGDLKLGPQLLADEDGRRDFRLGVGLRLVVFNFVLVFINRRRFNWFRRMLNLFVLCFFLLGLNRFDLNGNLVRFRRLLGRNFLNI